MSAFLNNPLQKVPIGLFLDEIDHITAEDTSPAKDKFLQLIAVLGLSSDEDGPVVNVDAQKISGGITNALYIVHLHFAHQKKTMVLRLFGFGTEQFIDRKVENIVFSSLSKSGHGPTFYGLFETGRVEGFLPNVQSLEPFEMSLPAVYRPVASNLVRLHATSIPEVDMLQHAWLWNKLELFFDLAAKLSFSSPEKQAQYNALNILRMRQELRWYRRYIESLHEAITSTEASASSQWSGHHFGQRLAMQRVLCHNDLLCGNIMRTSDVDVTQADAAAAVDITLIDYEYAGYNYRAYDLANHFCEFGGFEFNIRKDFPAEAVRRDFIRHYLARVLSLDDVDSVDDDIIAGFEDIVLRFTLASNFFWGTWSVVQAGSSSIDFDYLSYAALRYEAYVLHGTEYIGETFVQRVIDEDEASKVKAAASSAAASDAGTTPSTDSA